jgi:hypothetical protein
MLMATAVVGAGAPSLLVDEGELFEPVVEVALLPIIAVIGKLVVVGYMETMSKSECESDREVME